MHNEWGKIPLPARVKFATEIHKKSKFREKITLEKQKILKRIIARNDELKNWVSVGFISARFLLFCTKLKAMLIPVACHGKGKGPIMTGKGGRRYD